MVDITLTYGPGGTVAVLVQSIKALAFKAKMKVDVQVREGELADSLRLHLSSRAASEASSRMQKMLPLCFAIFSKRSAELSVELDDAHTIVLPLPPMKSRGDYKAATDGLFGLVDRFFASEDPKAREDMVAGARWVDGRAQLSFQGADQPLDWG